MKLFEIFGTVSVDSRGAMTELSKVDRQAGKTGEAFAKTGDKLQSAGKIAGQVGSTLTKRVTLPLTAMAGMAIKTGASFQQEMANVSAISGIVGDEFEDLEKLARDMGKATRFSATEAAEGLGYMGLAGWDATEMAEGLEPMLNLAGAAALDLGIASDIVTDTLSMFGMEAGEAEHMTNVLAAAQSKSNTTVTELSGSLVNVGSNANAMGYDIESTSAILGTFANQGLKGGKAGTTLSAILRDMKKSAEDGTIAIGDQSVAIVDSEGNYREYADIVEDIEQATDGMSAAQRDAELSTIFGDTAIRGLNMSLEDGSANLRELEGELRNSEDAAADMADVMGDTLQGRLDEMLSAFSEVGIIIFEIIEPALKLVLQILTLVAKGFQALPRPIQTVLVILGGLIAVVGPLLMLFSSVVGMFSKLSISGGVMTTVLSGASTALGLLKAGFALLTGPVGLAVAAIAAIVGVGYLVIKNWDAIRERFSAVWGFITDGFKGFGETIGGAMSSARDRASEAVDNMTDNLKENLGELSERADEFKERFSNTWEDVKVGTSEKMSEIGESIKGMGTSVSESWDDLKTSTSERLSEIGGNVKEFVGGITGSWKDLKAKTSETYNDIKDAMLKPIRTARDTVKNIVEQIKDFFRFEIKFPEIKMPKVRGEGGLIDRATPNFMKRDKPKRKRRFFARGGYMSNPTEFARDNRTSFIGGEAGGEGIVPLDGKHMQPMAAEIAKILRSEQGNGNETVNFNIDSLIGHATVREEADVRRIAEELEVLTDRKNRQRGAYS